MTATRSAFLLAVGLASILALALSCADDAALRAEHLAAAEAFQAEQKWSEARIELANALRLDPQSVETNLRVARLEATQERMDDALFYFEEAYRLDPDSVGAAAGIVGVTAFSDPERARSVASAIKERHPTDARVHIAAASVALVDGDVPTALVAALTAVELEPELADAHLQLGIVRAAEIRERRARKQELSDAFYSQAVEAFQRGLELAAEGEENADTTGTRLRAWIGKAKMYARWPKHREQMRSTLAEAFEDVHASEPGRRELVRTSLRLGRQVRDPALVRWALERVVEIDPEDYQAWGDLAILEQQKSGNGIAVLERLIAERPDDPRAHSIYARMLSVHGETQQAVSHLERIAGEIDGDVSPLLQRLLELQLAQQDLEAARATHAEMAAEYPDAGVTYQASAQLANAEGDPGAAVEWLTRWIEKRENVIGLRMLSQAELARGNARAALSAADSGLALARSEGRAQRPFLCARGQALLQEGETNLALQTLAGAFRAPGPRIPGCREALAESLYASGREAKGLEALEPVLAGAPSRAAVVLFARHEGGRQQERAYALLESYVTAHPSDAGVLTRLIRMDLLAGKSDEAIARARASAKNFPDSPGLNLLLSRTLASIGEPESALEILEKTIERWPEVPGTQTALLNLLGRLGRLGEAQEAFEKLHAEGNLPPASQVTLARMRSDDGDEKGARELLEAALAADPRLTSAANDLAYLLARDGDGADLDRATELAQMARGREPESSEIADTLGWVLQRRGLANAALAQFDEAIDLADPQSPAWATANYHRALSLRELGRTEEAIAAVERALAAGTDFPEAEEARATILALDRGTS